MCTSYSIVSQAVRTVNDAIVACARIEKFLRIDDEIVENDDVVDDYNKREKENGLEIANGEYVWSRGTSSQTNFTLEIPKLVIKPRTNVLVVGKYGAGKSSLLTGVFLREMKRLRCEKSNVNETFKGKKIAYCS